MAYKEKHLDKEGAKALERILGAANSAVEKRHKSPEKKTTKTKKK